MSVLSLPVLIQFQSPHLNAVAVLSLYHSVIAVAEEGRVRHYGGEGGGARRRGRAVHADELV